MKGAILQCDEVLAKFQPEFGRYPAMIERMFAAVADNIVCDCFDCRLGQYPENINDYDFFITTGSRSSVYDDEPWIEQLITFVRLLDKERKKLIGICFGHQVIAMASNGKVEKSEKGWAVGLANNRVVAAPEWIGEPVDHLQILVSHQDQISVLPNGATVIAESDFCPYFIIQWNDRFLSIQGHPEWRREYSKALMQDRRSLIGDEMIEAGIKSLAAAPDSQLFTRWLIDFIQCPLT
ncbi:GMP synthase [Desulfopila sp. IMCC35008]|uniref:glutamine amidotransferase-related protein n=1 Tax=Desulfopila sp. IMCC35008 TaxID=2653858 RepID=UPI0013D0753F|nr:GMP synthase [Desulfopila sp. IMCC35008]